MRKDTNAFIINKCHNVSVCPVANPRFHVNVLDLMGVDLRKGYLFRTTNKEGVITNNPVVVSTVANRLQTHGWEVLVYQRVLFPNRESH